VAIGIKAKDKILIAHFVFTLSSKNLDEVIFEIIIHDEKFMK
jgi:hypothetical protein